MATFEVQDVSTWLVHSGEVLGSKAKDWMRRGPAGDLWLFKYRRGDAGDDWAEKVSERLASLLHLPHARVELATRDGRRGVISRDFRDLKGKFVGDFVPANELMWRSDANYPKEQKRGTHQYTVSRSLAIIESLTVVAPTSGVDADPALDAADCFVGYLMFDAWIGNLDRHHENWGVLRATSSPETPVPILAPSFDHAASLGHNEKDDRRTFRLETANPNGTLEVWARSKCHSCFYGENGRPVRTFDAFDQAMAARPAAGNQWLQRLHAVDSEAVRELLDSVPEQLLSPIGRKFTFRLLDFNRRELLRRIPS